MLNTSPTERERFSALVESTVEGATKEHTTVFSAELNMLKFMYDQNSDPEVRERILVKARSLYRNWMFTLNRIEEYRAIAAPVDESLDARVE
ncbi:hypothetical protein K2P56_04385 [Patescibacteria group bacterium]|nr:hypothetical protein [Patescibacteria group bacterium]